MIYDLKALLEALRGALRWPGGGVGAGVTLPTGYRVERDPDVLVLRADDGRFVAAFGIRGATEESVRAVACQDRLAAAVPVVG
jgi:hypothetical protein